MRDHNEIVRWVASSIDSFNDRQPLWHPLGFVGCFLSPIRETSVRIHYWPKGERRPKQPDWPIHTHAFGLTSTVLFGALKDRRFVAREGANLAAYHINYLDAEGRRSQLTEGPDHYDAVCVEEQTYHAGATYYVPTDTFHTSEVPPDEEAVTIVTVSSLQDSGCVVLGSPGVDSAGYQRDPFDRELFWRIVASAFSNWRSLSTSCV